MSGMEFMMYQKAICFKDSDMAAQILAADDVSHIKQLGRLVEGYNDHYWNGVRQIIVYNGLLAKFMQNDNLRAMLLNTQNAVLAECAVKD